VSSVLGGTATAYADADADAETLDRWSRKHTTDKPCGRRTWRDAPAPPLHAVLSTAARRSRAPRAVLNCEGLGSLRCRGRGCMLRGMSGLV
jgi:hypothetical protein